MSKLHLSFPATEVRATTASSSIADNLLSSMESLDELHSLSAVLALRTGCLACPRRRSLRKVIAACSPRACAPTSCHPRSI